MSSQAGCLAGQVEQVKGSLRHWRKRRSRRGGRRRLQATASARGPRDGDGGGEADGGARCRRR